MEVRAVFRLVDEDWWELESAEHATKTDCRCDGAGKRLCQPLWFTEYVNCVGAADVLQAVNLDGLTTVIVQGRMVAVGRGEDADEWFELDPQSR